MNKFSESDVWDFLKANATDGMLIDPGEHQFAKTFNWDIKSVRAFFKSLESQGKIRYENINNTAVIILC